MCIYHEKYFTNYVEEVKDIECEGKSEDVSHSGWIQDRQWKCDMSTF